MPGGEVDLAFIERSLLYSKLYHQYLKPILRMLVGVLFAVEWLIKLSEGQGGFKISWSKAMIVALPLLLILSYEHFNAFYDRMDGGLGAGISFIFLFNGHSIMPLIQVLLGYVLVTCVTRDTGDLQKIG